MKKRIEARLQELLEAVIRNEGASKGNIQLYRPLTNDLVIITHKGFEREFLDYFKSVTAHDTSSCGRALGLSGVLGISSTILISDIEKDQGFEAHRSIARSSGFRSVKSVPIMINNTCLGMISTHFEEPKRNWVTEHIIEIMPELTATLSAYPHGE